jgi:hypothetical protein
MALEQFRPTLWSRSLIVDVEKALVFRNVANTSYQGEIAGAGSVVKINEIGDVTVNSYTEDSSLTYQTLSDAQKELVIDQKKYFAFLVDDVAQAQSNVEIVNAATRKAAHAIADEIDQHLAAKYTEAGVIDTSTLGTSVGTHQDVYASSSGNDSILAVITNMHKALDESNAPTEGRWVVWPAWAHAYLKYAGLVDNVAGGMKMMPNGQYGNGFIGNLLGFNMFASNNVSNNGTAYRVMYGTPDALSYAGQVARVESGRHPDYFADYVRGLYVYGSKVVRPDHLGVAYLDPVGLST